MKPSILLGSATIPDTNKQMLLYQHDVKFSITIPGRGELMNSRVNGSEKALAELTCERIKGTKSARLLIGGLGMGFTLASALEASASDAEVVVAELVPEVVDWNRDFMGEPAGHPLSDPRTTVYVGDVSDVIRQPESGFDAIMMDVDNGPEALIRRENDWIYSAAGLAAIARSLRPGGVLSVWSAGPDRLFVKRMKQAGFRVDERVVRPHRKGKGARHFIWFGTLSA
ncbi:spermidine synthase [Wenzhouxiangella sp. EGI_FJ10409]|uniref:spermidine synthase n=1 Tax=Wenzhouxiangella sp. EGI_FJ10409 TaxID=3243767 RepID=UPI0035DEBAF5